MASNVVGKAHINHSFIQANNSSRFELISCLSEPDVFSSWCHTSLCTCSAYIIFPLWCHTSLCACSAYIFPLWRHTSLCTCSAYISSSHCDVIHHYVHALHIYHLPIVMSYIIMYMLCIYHLPIVMSYIIMYMLCIYIIFSLWKGLEFGGHLYLGL